MPEQIVIALMTCDRPEYTRATVDALFGQNADRSRFVLIHGDDASSTGENAQIAAAAGFRTVVRHEVRCGVLATRIAMVEAAASFGEWVFVLENDIEAIREFPWDAFDFVTHAKGVYCLRLFGQFKDAERRDPCKTTNQWARNQHVRWRGLKGAPESMEIGQIHWTSQPNVARIRALQSFYRKGNRDLGWTMRVKRNAFVHIGTERTERKVG